MVLVIRVVSVAVTVGLTVQVVGQTTATRSSAGGTYTGHTTSLLDDSVFIGSYRQSTYGVAAWASTAANRVTAQGSFITEGILGFERSSSG